ncbi:MAG: CHRD domain-containing protein [Dehalococcoidia bacterium]|nr:CHRD domain-containing protein [Dehalococcoidia bacterium]
MLGRNRRNALGAAAALTLALAALAALAPAIVSGQSAQYSAQLTGASEVPATTSTATGTFSATLNEAAKTLQWTLNVPTITNATMAHIHAGAAGTNGGVVVTLFSPQSPAGSVSASGTAGPNDLAGPFAGNWDGFVAALKSGGLYVNVHTSANPGGEIRGQVQAPGQGTPTATASASATATSTASSTATASPVAPKTGQAGLVQESSNSGAAIIFVAVAVALVAGSRLLTSRDR